MTEVKAEGQFVALTLLKLSDIILMLIISNFKNKKKQFETN